MYTYQIQQLYYFQTLVNEPPY